MGLIKWNKFYSVHIEEIDNQHKRLIDLINRMYDAMKSGKGRDALSAVLAELVDYTVYHFETEERMFLQHGYAEYEAHKIIHDDLTRRTRELKDQLDRGNDLITMDVMLFLSNWLNVHILEVDKKYVPYLGSKMSSSNRPSAHGQRQ
jgi:hemerythrin